MSITEYIFEGEEFGLQELTWTSYIWLVQEVVNFHSSNDHFWIDDFQGEHVERLGGCSCSNYECLDDEVSNATSNSARNKGL